MIKKILKSKNAGERYLSIWMFIVWIFVGIAIVYGVLIFKSEQADTRQLEADLLGTRTLDCLAEKFDVTKTGFDLYSECGINKEVIEKSGKYYLSFNVKDKSSGKEVLTFKAGASVWQTECDYQKERKKLEKNFAQCAYKTLEYLGDDNNIYYVNLISAVNK